MKYHHSIPSIQMHLGYSEFRIPNNLLKIGYAELFNRIKIVRKARTHSAD